MSTLALTKCLSYFMEKKGITNNFSLFFFSNLSKFTETCSVGLRVIYPGECALCT